MTTRTRVAVGVALAVAVAAIATWAFVSRADARGLTIHVDTIRDVDGIFHRRWTFTSGRRWESFGTGTRGGGHFAVLDPPAALAPSEQPDWRRGSGR